MSVVVADTSPLNYLVQCGAIEVLTQLYGQVLIPPAVLDELLQPGAPEAVHRWIASPPPWVIIQSPRIIDAHLTLGQGETEAICLAREIQADLILLDERRARIAAVERGLSVTGTLGVLEAAAQRHLLLLPEVVEKLRRTNFRINPALLKSFLKRNTENLGR